MVIAFRFFLLLLEGTGKWAQRDSNPWPTGYEPVALTRLSYGPVQCKSLAQHV